MSDIKLLELLKRIEWGGYSSQDTAPYGSYCPSCGGFLHFGGHGRPIMGSPNGVDFPICELKATIDRLEAEGRMSDDPIKEYMESIPEIQPHHLTEALKRFDFFAPVKWYSMDEIKLMYPDNTNDGHA